MGTGASLVPDKGDALKFDAKDDVEWVYIVREALKHEELLFRFVSFLKKSQLSLQERYCVRLFIELDKLTQCCNRALRCLKAETKDTKILNKMATIKRDIKSLVEHITNAYVVVDAKRRVALSRAVIHRFGLISGDVSVSGTKAGSGSGSGSGAKDDAEVYPSSSSGLTDRTDRSSFVSDIDSPDHPKYFGVYTPKELLELILEVQHEMVPFCREFLQRFMSDRENAELMQDAMLSHKDTNDFELQSNASEGELNTDTTTNNNNTTNNNSEKDGSLSPGQYFQLQQQSQSHQDQDHPPTEAQDKSTTPQAFTTTGGRIAQLKLDDLSLPPTSSTAGAAAAVNASPLTPTRLGFNDEVGPQRQNSNIAYSNEVRNAIQASMSTDSADGGSPSNSNSNNNNNTNSQQLLSSPKSGKEGATNKPFSPEGDEPPPPDKVQARGHMLVVDDSYPMLKMLSFALTRQGVHVTGAQSGETALDLMKRNHYDAVLIDLNMPSMDGYHLAYQYRKHEVQLRTARSSASSSSSATAAGARAATGTGAGTGTGTGAGTGTGTGKQEKQTSADAELIPFVASIVTNANDDPALQERQLLIAMSSDSTAQVQEKVAECGMDYFLRKPFTAATVVDLLSSARGIA